MVTAVAQVDEIELAVVQSGTRVVSVPKLEYEQAKKDGSLPWFLDPYINGIETDFTVTEPDGTAYNPYWLVD